MITAQRKAFLIVPIKQFMHTHILKTVNQLKQKTDIRIYSVYENIGSPPNLFAYPSQNTIQFIKFAVDLQTKKFNIKYHGF
jgi:hypothetical protein